MAKCDSCNSERAVWLLKANGLNLVRCIQCELHYVDPMPDSKVRLEHVSAGIYAENKYVLSAEAQLAAEKTMESQFRSYIDLAIQFGPSGGRYLDVGCGSGYLMAVARKAGYFPEGIELTRDRLELASQTAGSVVHSLPVEELGFEDNIFNAITLINVFSHLAEPRKTFEELGRILTPGGVLVVATGEIDGTVRQQHLHEWTLGDELFYLGKGTIERYAKHSGLQVVHTQRIWLPDAIYSRERFRVRGRSRIRNAMKLVMLAPGALPVLRAIMRRQQQENPIYSAVFVLRKPS